MAALSATSLVFTVWGDKMVVIGSIASIADADTWAVPGMGNVEQVHITKTTAAAAQDIGATRSGATVTFKVESGTPTARVTAIGN